MPFNRGGYYVNDFRAGPSSAAPTTAKVVLKGTTTTASVYADEALTVPLANPLPAGVAPGSPGIDTLGNVSFYAGLNNTYDVIANGTTVHAPLSLSQTDLAALAALISPNVTAPTGTPTLTATAGNAAASLSWTAVTGATAYQVSVGGRPVSSVTGLATTLALANGTPVALTVTASNNAGVGPASNGVTVTPTAPAATAATGILQKTSGSASSVTSLSVSWPAAPTTGSLLVAVVAGQIPNGTPNASMTSTGWTQVNGPTPTYTSLDVFTKTATASEPAVVSGMPTAGWMVTHLFEIAAATATTVDVSAVNSSGISNFTSLSTGTTATTSSPTDLCLATWAFPFGDPSATYSTGYTQQLKTGITGELFLNTATLQTTSAGAQSARVSLPTSSQGGACGMIVTFNAGAVAGTVATTGSSTGTNPISTTSRSGLPWLSGVYPTGLADGNYVSRVQSFENGRGKLTDIVEGTEPNDTWASLTGGYVFNAYAGYPGTLVISTAMIPNDGSTIAAGATGAYDQHWKDYGTMMNNTGRSKSVLRIGWEFDGNWYPWSASDPTNWIAYFRRIVTNIRSTNPQAIICWNGQVGAPQCGGGVTNVFTQLYPGDSYVDIVGFDVYDMYDKRVYDETTWSAVRRLHGQGLDDWMDFAKAHGKKCSIPEWGCETNATDTVNKGGDNPFFVQKMMGWIQANAADLAFESYFDEQASYIANSLFDPQQMPNAAAAYKNNLHA